MLKPSSRFLKFFVVGGGCTLLDFLLFSVLFYGTGLHLVAANLISYGTGLAVAFFINRAWTFADSGKRETRRIFLSLFWGYVGLFINTALVWALAWVMHALLAKVVAVVAVLFYNYLVNKYLVFRTP